MLYVCEPLPGCNLFKSKRHRETRRSPKTLLVTWVSRTLFPIFRIKLRPRCSLIAARLHCYKRGAMLSGIKQSSKLRRLQESLQRSPSKGPSVFSFCLCWDLGTKLLMHRPISGSLELEINWQAEKFQTELTAAVLSNTEIRILPCLLGFWGLIFTRKIPETLVKTIALWYHGCGDYPFILTKDESIYEHTAFIDSGGHFVLI